MSQAYVYGFRAPRRAGGRADAAADGAGFDFVVVSVIASLIYVLLLVLTLGLSFFFLPPLWPIVAFFYNGVSMSGPRHATPGMRAMDLEVRMHDSGRAGPVPQRRRAWRVLLSQLVLPAGVPGDAGRRREALPARHPVRRRRVAAAGEAKLSLCKDHKKISAAPIFAEAVPD